MSTLFRPMIPSPRIAEGPDASRAAWAVAQAEERRKVWPYTHIYPPDTARRRNPEGYVVAPAQGSQVVVMSFKVPSGFRFVLQGLILTVSPISVLDTLGPGCMTFTIDRNNPVIGTTTPQGTPIADWTAINFPYGSMAVGPNWLAMPEIFAPYDVVTVKVLNNTVDQGTPNYFVARFYGYEIPDTGK